MHIMLEPLNLNRRFGGISRLYGATGLNKLQHSHVVVIGIGGVGSWAVEALARNAVGKITLIDLDNINESNVNRQIHALEGAFGKAKVSAMRERILAINPGCQVSEIEDFVKLDNIDKLLDFDCDVVLDCIDDTQAKIALAVYCRAQKIPLIMAGSAGGRLDPTRIKVADLSSVVGDRLLAKVRNQLRRDHQFPKNCGPEKTGFKLQSNKNSAQFAITCVYSDEQIIKPEIVNVQIKHFKSDDILEAKHANAITGLNCAGYGSSVCVTAPFGFTAAQLAINLIVA